MVRSGRKTNQVLRDFVNSYYLYDLDCTTMMYMIDEGIIEDLKTIELKSKRDVLAKKELEELKRNIIIARIYSKEIADLSFESRYKKDNNYPLIYNLKKGSIDEFQPLYEDICNNTSIYKEIVSKNIDKLSLIFPQLLELNETGIITKEELKKYGMAKTRRDLKSVLNIIRRKSQENNSGKIVENIEKINSIINLPDYDFEIMNLVKFYGLSSADYNDLHECNREYKALINKKNKMLNI